MMSWGESVSSSGSSWASVDVGMMVSVFETFVVARRQAAVKGFPTRNDDIAFVTDGDYLPCSLKYIFVFCACVQWECVSSG
jgi:hypothetical protein